MNTDVVATSNRDLSESQKIAISSLEAWLEQWLGRALPIYMHAFHAFMGIVRDKKGGSDDITVEASIFYEALIVTREFTGSTDHIDILFELVVPLPVADEFYPYVTELDLILADIESRCVCVEGEMCVAKEDLVELVKIAVKLVAELGAEFSKLVEKFIKPFNEFMQDFDKSIVINYVDGEYHLLLKQEFEDLEVKNQRLVKENQKLLYTRSPSRSDTQVYVVSDKSDLVEYIRSRWSRELILTKQSEESLLDAGYRDIKKLISVFDILAEDFYPVYESSQRLEPVIDKLQDINAEFKPKLSDKAKGRHLVFEREYKGKLADFDRHICLGSSRDSQHCFRLHFEFDEEESVIVVHHAGDHLPMSDD